MVSSGQSTLYHDSMDTNPDGKPTIEGNDNE